MVFIHGIHVGSKCVCVGGGSPSSESIDLYKKTFCFNPCVTEPHLCLLSGNKTKDTVTTGNASIYILRLK